MKGLVITLLIVSLLYLFIFREQAKQLDALPKPSVGTDMNEAPAIEEGSSAASLQPYQRPLDKAKGVEAMLNQGVQDRRRSIEGLEGGE